MDQISRRHFTKLSAAALGGMLAGTQLVHAEEKKDEKKKEAKPADKHFCRGLNTCKGKGGCGATASKNACLGQGECATISKHACKGHNDCKAQGGCGEIPGQNACKGKGDCAVPLNDAAWGRARGRFIRAMKEQKKKVGTPPPKKK